MTPHEVTMRDDALRMVTAAVAAVDPRAAVRGRLRLARDAARPAARALVAAAGGDASSRDLTYDLSDYDEVQILAFGKASAAMALAVAEVVSGAPSDPAGGGGPGPAIGGLAIIKDDHATEEEIETLQGEYNVRVRSAAHPVPDARSVAGAEEMLRLAAAAGARTLVVVCVSGGGSALFCAPRDPLVLEDLSATNARLLASGMPIEGMNVVRKRLEKGKGGRLAATYAYPATVLTLILSDIIGDPLDLIASGPTVPDDDQGWEKAWGLVEEYGLTAGGEHALPRAVLELLRQGKEGAPEDAPTSAHPAFATARDGTKRSSESVLVGNNYAAVVAAADMAESLGYHPVVLGTRVDGEAASVAGVHVALAEMLTRQRRGTVPYPLAALPAALIAGGETTVALGPAPGRGGRNQELALAAALKLRGAGLRDVVLVSAGTDGTDGPTDAAGAVVHGGLVHAGTVADAEAALREHDAYTFFDGLEGPPALVRTGPTGTNVADICITLVR